MTKQKSVEDGHQGKVEDESAIELGLPGYPIDDDFEEESVNHYTEDLEDDSDNPDGDDIDPDEEENDDEGEPEEEEEEDVAEEIEGKSAKYFQSEWHKTQEELKRLKEEFSDLAEHRGLIRKLQEDPEAAIGLMQRWSSPQHKVEQEEIKEPVPPQDFDVALMYTPGTQEYKFRQESEAYQRKLIAREAEERAARIAEERLRPLQESQQVAARKAEVLRLLASTNLPVDKYEDFLSHSMSKQEELAALASYYMQKNGLQVEKKEKTDAKKKEFERVKKNANKPAGGKKTGHSEKKLDDNASYMESLRQVAATRRFD